MLDWLKKMFGGSNVFLNADRKLPKGMFVNATPIADPDTDGFQKILPVGYFPNHPSGAHEITNETIQQMFANFMVSSQMLLLDYEHNSLFGNTRAAGWSPALQVRADDGLYWKYPDMTPAAAEMIKNKEYRFFSPAYKLVEKDLSGRLIGAVLDSVALTNKPILQTEIDHIKNSQSNLEEIEMKLTPEEKKAIIANHGLPADATDEVIENALKNSEKAEKSLFSPEERKAIIANHGLPADATDEVIKNALLSSRKADPPKPTPGSEEDVVAKSPAFQTLANSIKAIVDGVKADREKSDVDLVDRWKREFQILPAYGEEILNSLRNPETRQKTIEKYNAVPAGTHRPARVNFNLVKNANPGDPPKKKSFDEITEDFRMTVNSAQVRAIR